jgi:hypothetical protein
MPDFVSYAPYIAVAFVLVGVGGLMWSRRSEPQKPVEDVPCEVVSDWGPTGKIDFARRDINGKPEGSLFCLQTEEYRVLQSMSGTRRVEVRWRAATLDEACQVASRHNARATLLARELPQAGGIDGAALVPELPEDSAIEPHLSS